MAQEEVWGGRKEGRIRRNGRRRRRHCMLVLHSRGKKVQQVVKPQVAFLCFQSENEPPTPHPLRPLLPIHTQDRTGGERPASSFDSNLR